MKDVNWTQAKEAANNCVWKINPRLTIYSDPVADVFDNNLPSVLSIIAKHCFIYGYGDMGQNIIVIKNALIQIEDTGFIGGWEEQL